MFEEEYENTIIVLSLVDKSTSYLGRGLNCTEGNRGMNGTSYLLCRQQADCLYTLIYSIEILLWYMISKDIKDNLYHNNAAFIF